MMSCPMASSCGRYVLLRLDATELLGCDQVWAKRISRLWDRAVLEAEDDDGTMASCGDVM